MFDDISESKLSCHLLRVQSFKTVRHGILRTSSLAQNPESHHLDKRLCEVTIQSQHPQLGLTSGRFQRGSLTRILYAVFSSSYPHVRHIVAFSILLPNTRPLDNFGITKHLTLMGV